jgi:hypothetical protein
LGYIFGIGLMWRKTMTRKELRALARKCRKWAKSSIDPDNIALFRIWATDLADEAGEIEHGTEYRPHHRQRAGPDHLRYRTNR